jgi:hypothetical protein
MNTYHQHLIYIKEPSIVLDTVLEYTFVVTRNLFTQLYKKVYLYLII